MQLGLEWAGEDADEEIHGIMRNVDGNGLRIM